MLTYTYRYNRIIKWFRDHPVSKETCQCENHHIIPKSCGGLDIKENLILLPLRWHYIVHCWLPAVYLEQGKQKEYEKMLFAWNRFRNYRKNFREGLQTIKEDSLLYQKLRQEFINLEKRTKKGIYSGIKHYNYGHHWWKDPNDKTKSLSIKEGDPVPEGWVRGRWNNVFKNKRKITIYNIETNKRKLIYIDELVPNGWYIPNRSYKCKWCGAKKERDRLHKSIISNCSNKDLCWHFQPVKKLIKYFGFDKTKIGTYEYYSEYNKAAIKFFKLWNSFSPTVSKLAEQIKWENSTLAGLFSLYRALSKIFPQYVNII